MPHKDPNQAPKADYVQCFKCDSCEHLHVALMDEADRFIAIAIMTKEMLEGMLAAARGGEMPQ